jgi:hypothetical protein
VASLPIEQVAFTEAFSRQLAALSGGPIAPPPPVKPTAAAAGAAAEAGPGTQSAAAAEAGAVSRWGGR